MRVSITRLNYVDFSKFFKSVIAKRDENLSLNNIRNQYNKFYYVYKKVVKQDEVEHSLNKVNVCHYELTKFRENQVDYISRLTNIRFELNRLNSSIHEAKRLENDIRFLELTRQERKLENEEKLLRNCYNNSEKREQSLKDALAITRDELHMKQTKQSNYEKFLFKIIGAFVTSFGFMIYCFRMKNESTTNFEALVQEFKELTQKMDERNKSGPGFTHYVLKYSGVNYMLSWFTNNNSDKTDSKHGYWYYLGYYTGINYIYSKITSRK